MERRSSVTKRDTLSAGVSASLEPAVSRGGRGPVRGWRDSEPLARAALTGTEKGYGHAGRGLLFGVSEKAAKSHRKFLSVVRLSYTGRVLELLLERRKGPLHRMLPEPLPAGGTCTPGPAARAAAS